MRLPKLDRGYFWELTETQAVIRKVLPDKEVIDNGYPTYLSDDPGVKSRRKYRETHPQQVSHHGTVLRLAMGVITFYDRSKEVYSEKVSWGKEPDAREFLKGVRGRWGLVRKVPFGEHREREELR